MLSCAVKKTYASALIAIFTPLNRPVAAHRSWHMKKILGILACLAVVAALAGYFVVIPQIEEKQAAQVAAFIEELPGTLKADAITVRLLENKVEVLGLKGDTKYIEGSDMTVDVGRITVSGVNFTPGAGVASLVDEADFRDVKLRITTTMAAMGVELPPEMNKPIVQNLTLKDMTVKGLSGDYERLNAAVKADSRADIYDCLATTFSVAQITLNEYASHVESFVGPASMSIQSMSAKDASLLKSGPSTCETVSLSMFGAEVMRVGSMRVDLCRMPNVYPALVAAQESGDAQAMSNALFNLKEGESFSVEGMVMKDFYFKLLLPEPLTAASVGMDFSLGKDSLAYKQSLEELVIPVSMYRSIGMEVAQFADYYGQPLSIDAVIDADFRWQPGRADVAFKRLFIEDKGLGAASLSAALYLEGEGDSVEAFADGDPRPFLVKADLTLEDKALLANVFGGEFEAIKAFGLTGEGMESPEDLRAQAVALFEAQMAAFVSDDQKKVGQGVLELLKAPGKLTVTLTPDAPVALEGLEQGKTPLNAQVEFTPAPAPDAEPVQPTPAVE